MANTGIVYVGRCDASGNLSITRVEHVNTKQERRTPIVEPSGSLSARRQEMQLRLGLDTNSEENAIARIREWARDYRTVRG